MHGGELQCPGPVSRSPAATSARTNEAPFERAPVPTHVVPDLAPSGACFRSGPQLRPGVLAVASQVVGDSRGDEGSAGGMAGADIAPGGVRDRAGCIVVPLVCSPFRPQRRVRRRIRPGLGEDVPAEPEGVSPGPQPQMLELGQAAKPPAGSHQGPDMRRGGHRVDVAPGREPPIGAGRRFARPFGDVLGHVRSHGVVTQLVVLGTSAERPNVDLSAPSQPVLANGRAVGRPHDDGTGSSLHGGAEPSGCAPDRRWVYRTGRAIESDDGVDVNCRALLILGDLGEGQSGAIGKVALRQAGRHGEASTDGTSETVPEFPGVGMPEDMRHVVVAVSTERLADQGVSGVVDGGAACRSFVCAVGRTTSRSAAFPGGGRAMNRAEGRSGECDEEPGVFADVVRDVLAADEPGADEVERVSGMEAGAGGTDSGPAVAAADQEVFAGFVSCVVVVQDLAGRGVAHGGRTGQVDRVGAAAGRGDLLKPAGELQVLRKPDGVAVDFGELTQARRTVEDGAPVSRGDLGGDGGDLPGWAAEAARWLGDGVVSSMAFAPWWSGVEPAVSGWFPCPGRSGTCADGRSRWYGPLRPCSEGSAHGAWAWCVSRS